MFCTRLTSVVASCLLAPLLCAQGTHSLAIFNIDPVAHSITIGVTNSVPINVFEFKLVDGLGNAIPVTSISGGAAGASGWTLTDHTQTPDLIVGMSPTLVGLPASQMPYPLVELTYQGSPRRFCLDAPRLIDLNVLLSPPADTAGCLTLPVDDCNRNQIPDVSDEAFGLLLDLNVDGIYDQCQPFSAMTSEASVSAGGAQNWTLNAGVAHAGEVYIVIGSESAANPGFVLQGLAIPLVLDIYMMETLARPNVPPLWNSFGVLDHQGRAQASISAGPGELHPALVGATVHHAFVTVAPSLPGARVLTSVSNQIPLRLIP